MNNKMRTFKLMCAILACCTALPQLALADGLADLKAALSREQGKSAIKASLELKTWSRDGEDKDMVEKTGLATISVEDDQSGMQLLYSRDLLTRLEAERRAKELDHLAKTPATNATNDINTKTVQEMLSAAAAMSALLEKAELKTERADTCNGKPARLLSFVYTKEKLTPKEREHLKKYDGGIDIWIAEDGTPLASRSHEIVTASFLMLVSFDISNEDSAVYGVVGERLIALRVESKGAGSGLGQKGESVSTKTLHIQS